MVQWVKRLLIKPEDLSSIPGSHVKTEKKNQLRMDAMAYMPFH